MLGLVCAKMDKRVSLSRKEDEDRRAKQEDVNLVGIVVNESGEEEDTEDVEGARDEREIWEAAHESYQQHPHSVTYLYH